MTITPRAPHATSARLAAPRPAEGVDHESTTRARVLQHVLSDGPVTAAALARMLDLSAAGIRRHLGCLEDDGLVAVHVGRPTGGRGRPARSYVATDRAHAEISGEYPDIASQALRFLAEIAGDGAVEEFAQARMLELEERYSAVVTADDVDGRVRQLADALSADGFAASVRPVEGTSTVQLCQGHCPVAHVAAQFPQLCDAEAQVFSRLLGSHTQRLVTLANGGHVCTTNVPVHVPMPRTRSARPGVPEPPGRTGTDAAGPAGTEDFSDTPEPTVIRRPMEGTR
ncbi:helix-turn-helix transcriptional regulator [Sanguibacter inulinus]|uniref:Helix-turn-helix domain-containing protein n=1 Tax=Sanguibacter inulinus TaxID=60922 RepID=A0A853EUK4_9MICO|nr:helix-turn-helix domain-containing protein [Sanguibacter inulinus]MBF0722299.1 helix-turn-helix domain-containing protein [Sanguibacter inulinus]NYS93444.1 helix-turn-helix domain-containing protein [Sanguibacter inulinus]